MVVTIVAPGGAGAGVVATKAPNPHAPPPVKHVVIVVLENSSFHQVAGPTFAKTMPYLSSLAAKGVTLDQMFAVGHASLDNYIAMTSGYEPNSKTSADCLKYNCVYPVGQDDNIANQLEQKGLTWKGYMDGMTRACQKPPTPGRTDPYQVGYATRHDPFMYYASIVDDATRCASHVVPFTQLATDLTANQLPSYSFISPSTCNDAHDGGVACGLTHADTWLKDNIQPVLDSKSFKDGGVLIVTTDESELSDASGCCGNARGGHIATFVVGPLVAKAGSHTATQYTHYGMLRWVEDSFGLRCLRHACDAGSKPFGADVVKAAKAKAPKTKKAKKTTTS